MIQKYFCVIVFLLIITSCEKFLPEYGSEGLRPGTGAHLLATGIVFIGSDDASLYAFSATDGKKKWSAQTGGPLSTAPVVDVHFYHNGAISSSSVITGSEDGSVYAFDSFSGKQLWKFKTGGPIIMDPLIADGVLIVHSEDGNLYGLNIATGEQIWTAVTHGGVGPRLLAYQGLVYCSSKDGKLYAVRISDGNIQWSEIAGTGACSSPVLSVANFIYVGSDDSTLVGFEATGGAMYYTSLHCIARVVNAPVDMDRDMIYANFSNGFIAQIDGGSAVSWTDYGVGNCSPTLVNRILYLADTTGLVYQIPISSDHVGGGSGFQAGGPINSSPTVAHETIFIGCDDHNLYAFDTNHAGEVKWSTPTNGKIHSSPCVMDTLGVVYHPYFSGYQ